MHRFFDHTHNPKLHYILTLISWAGLLLTILRLAISVIPAALTFIIVFGPIAFQIIVALKNDDFFMAAPPRPTAFLIWLSFQIFIAACIWTWATFPQYVSVGNCFVLIAGMIASFVFGFAFKKISKW